MTPTTAGWWSAADSVPADGDVDYGYLLGDDTRVLPDPRSRRQPAGVHERSRTFDHTAYEWQDERLDRPAARRLGDLRAARRHVHPRGHVRRGPRQARPPALDLGVDFVELMPVNAFNGTHDWGYDGVLWSPVHEPYGGPAGYQRFVDACHAPGSGVHPGRRLQPPRPVRELPAASSGPTSTTGPQHVGRRGQPRRRGIGRGPPLHPRQRADVARRLPRRRPAPRRRARARRRVRAAPPAGDRRARSPPCRRTSAGR